MMSVKAARRVRFWSCTRKKRYRIRDHAMEDSTVQRGETQPYRCPFCKGHHVGRLASMRSLGRIAEAIRVLGQEESAA